MLPILISVSVTPGPYFLAARAGRAATATAPRCGRKYRAACQMASKLEAPGPGMPDNEERFSLGGAAQDLSARASGRDPRR